MQNAKYKMQNGARRFLLLLGILLLSGVAGADIGDRDLLSLRQEYNAVSARIDSLVRAMETVDAEALDARRLPGGKEEVSIPDGMSVVLIFWADDEARVWINDYLVGETRLAPVEIAVPPLYLQGSNRLRARCWDTDEVESGFLCGLYLKDTSGALHPILVSDGAWKAGEGQAVEMTYAHPAPDISGAQVIWGSRFFGTVTLEQTFDRGAIQQAVARGVAAGRSPAEAQRSRMDYHAFVQDVARLQERRKALKQRLEQRGEWASDVPLYSREGERSMSLTLGKAGPLQEALSVPVAQEVQTWARELPEAQQRLIYPERRGLKGEGAATPAREGAPGGEAAGERQAAYRPPEDRGPGGDAGGKDGEGPSGRGASSEGTGGEGTGVAGTGGQGVGGAGGAGGGFGRASRLGLLLPTLVLMLYVGYVVLNWRDLTGGEKRYPWD